MVDRKQAVFPKCEDEPLLMRKVGPLYVIKNIRRRPVFHFERFETLEMLFSA